MALIFPRLVYRGPAVHMLVTGAEAFDAARAAGWFASVPEAVAREHADPAPLIAPPVEAPAPAPVAPTPAPAPEPGLPDDEAPPTRAELEQKAHELGIKVDGRWSDKRVGDAIAAKLAKKA